MFSFSVIMSKGYNILSYKLISTNWIGQVIRGQLMFSAFAGHGHDGGYDPPGLVFHMTTCHISRFFIYIISISFLFINNINILFFI